MSRTRDIAPKDAFRPYGGNKILQGYHAATDPDLVARLEAISSDQLFALVRAHIPDRPGRVLDVGAGTGRDAAWLAAQGHGVVAVEPVVPLRQAAKALHPSARIQWVDDILPALPRTHALGQTFDLVMLIGVWHHLDTAKRQLALSSLRSLTADNGRVVISIRRGPSTPTRPAFPADVAHTLDCALASGFTIREETRSPSIQPDNRQAGVSWTWLVLQAA